MAKVNQGEKKVKTIFNKIAAILAFIIGGMAVFAGINVLLGNDPGYYVINWLPIYNYTAGILSVFITAILIWTNHKFAKWMTFGTLAVHSLVMVILQTAYRSVVAPDSIMAMTIRISVWVIILGLIWIQSRKSHVLKQATVSTSAN